MPHADIKHVRIDIIIIKKNGNNYYYDCNEIGKKNMCTMSIPKKVVYVNQVIHNKSHVIKCHFHI